MRSRFQQGLDELKEKLLRMGGLAEQAIDRATEVLLQESNATARELFQKTVETKEWLSMPRPTLRSSIFERIVREARRRAGVPAKLGAPHKN